MKNLSYEEKVQRNILKDVRMKRIPSRTNIPHPIFYFCQLCKKNKVTDHHYLCNKCWKIKNNGKYNNKR